MINHIARQVVCMKISSVADRVGTKLARDRYRNVTGHPIPIHVENTSSPGWAWVA
jgi:hypothetical protein